MQSRFLVIVAILCFGILTASAQTRHIVVADSLTHTPLPNASIFNNKGSFIGTSSTKGHISCALLSDFPITIRYIGYAERSVPKECGDTIFLIENISELHEVIVESKQRSMLHILAYMREYSSLSSYTDTITMFREKMVDFMLPTEKKTNFRGWHYPRPLSTRSYYHYTNFYGLDSVSDRCSHHFTWSDWIGMIPTTQLPIHIANIKDGVDTIYGKYGPTEIWIKNDDRLSIDIDVLADTVSRKWVPNISFFFSKEDTDFEQFRLKVNYTNILGNEISPLDLTGFSYNIESRGRGRGMFQFNRHDQPFFVTTYAEVYILDKELISAKEAKKWDKLKFPADEIGIIEPQEAPKPNPSTMALINRVNNIDSDQVRLSIRPDERLTGQNGMRRKISVGRRALNMLKEATGISEYKYRKNLKDKWGKFRDNQRQRKRDDK